MGVSDQLYVSRDGTIIRDYDNQAAERARPAITTDADAWQKVFAAGRQAVEDFVKESIVDPNAYIQPGFPKSVMVAACLSHQCHPVDPGALLISSLAQSGKRFEDMTRPWKGALMAGTRIDPKAKERFAEEAPPARLPRSHSSRHASLEDVCMKAHARARPLCQCRIEPESVGRC